MRILLKGRVQIQFSPLSVLCILLGVSNFTEDVFGSGVSKAKLLRQLPSNFDEIVLECIGFAIEVA